MTNPGRKRLILFTRYPVPGKVKTRLIPALGAQGAVGLHRRLVLRTLRIARKVCETIGADLEVQFDGGTEEQMHHWVGDQGTFTQQSDGDLGARMGNAFEASFRQGSPATVIIGTDCPALTPGILATAFDRLAERRVVLGPANDGGYYLIGLTSPLPELFRGISWGTETVLANSLGVLEKGKIAPALLGPLDDLDRPEDLPQWEALTRNEDGDLHHVSVIIPTLNEEAHIVSAVSALQKTGPFEIIVADGGSADRTLTLAKQAGARVVVSGASRARQMNAGAAQANGSVLLFLHVDTVPPANWPNLISETMRRPGIAAGAFHLQINGQFPGKRMIERSANLRSKWLQLPYGDQGLFLARPLFEALGGFANLPIMEDYEMVRRLRRFGSVVTLPQPARTSARRWERFGVLRTTLTNQLMLAGYHVGVSPKNLARFYRGRA
jgi:rSAM/selenodomain-associated transferase 2/rSAM/selenodomain-associated transferase 1